MDSSGELFAVPSLLYRLKSPQASDLARKRKLKCNLPKGTKKGKGSVASNPKNVSPLDRVKAYPNEHFTVSYNKKLFCSTCQEEVAIKKSVIECHIVSRKHKKGKERLASREKQEFEIIESRRCYKEVHCVGEKLPESTRVKVAGSMLKAGVPLTKLINFVICLYFVRLFFFTAAFSLRGLHTTVSDVTVQ